MNDFKKGGFRKGGGDFGGRPKFGNKFGGGDRKFGGGRKFGNKFGGGRGGDKPFGRPELFPATCSSCGKPCEVPFRPTGEKPVYCRDCFGKQEQAPWRKDTRAPRFERPSHDSRDSRGGAGDIEGLKHRILALEGKLDRVLEILGGSKKEMSAPVAAKEEAKKEMKEKKDKKPKAKKK
jgi:CxxC-x17-CxxC domain-containing protein